MKKAFSSIHIVMILGSLMLALLVITEAASSLAAKSICSDAVYVTGRSLLGEYNKALYNRYGIFLLQAYEDEANIKAKDLFDYDFDTSKTVVKLRLKTVDVDFSSYPALDVNALEKQIEKISVVALKDKALGRHNDNVKLSGHPTVPEEILPSKLLGYKSRESVLLSGGISDISVGTALEDEYILAMTSNSTRIFDDTYLSYETEYILFGYKTDEENLASMRRSIYAVRYAKDLASSGTLPTDPASLAIALAAIALQAETEVDRIVSGESIDEMDYEAYLRLFLTLLDKEEKIARLMDIMQINVSHIDGSGFSFSDYAYGFTLTANFEKRVLTSSFLGMDRRFKTIEEDFCYK